MSDQREILLRLLQQRFVPVLLENRFVQRDREVTSPEIRAAFRLDI
jgi:hypothetical protein